MTAPLPHLAGRRIRVEACLILGADAARLCALVKHVVSIRRTFPGRYPAAALSMRILALPHTYSTGHRAGACHPLCIGVAFSKMCKPGAAVIRVDAGRMAKVARSRTVLQHEGWVRVTLPKLRPPDAIYVCVTAIVCANSAGQWADRHHCLWVGDTLPVRGPMSATDVPVGADAGEDEAKGGEHPQVSRNRLPKERSQGAQGAGSADSPVLRKLPTLAALS